MIEAATQAQAPALALIHASAFLPPANWDGDAIALQLALPGGFGWIDSDGGMILARAVADQSEILTLAVTPLSRRHGIGSRLLLHAMEEAARRGARMMTLEAAVGNAPACALYAAHGFVRAGRRRGYYPDGGDAIVLRAELGPV